MAFYTEAGKKFGNAITEWLQDTRLMSEACFRFYKEFKKKGEIEFNKTSWPKPPKGELPMPEFKINPGPLAQRMESLLKSLWSSKFVFLESFWEEYLQDIVLDLRHKDSSIFEPFCERDFMVGIVRDVLTGELSSIEEIKDEAAARFATGITRQPWKTQWKQLARLKIGLSESDELLPWFKDMDVYFEMRNCIIHRKSRISPLLGQKTNYYSNNDMENIEIWPQHLDFYRRRFVDCVGYIESKIDAKYKDVTQ